VKHVKGIIRCIRFYFYSFRRNCVKRNPRPL